MQLKGEDDAEDGAQAVGRVGGLTSSIRLWLLRASRRPGVKKWRSY